MSIEMSSPKLGDGAPDWHQEVVKNCKRMLSRLLIGPTESWLRGTGYALPDQTERENLAERIVADKDWAQLMKTALDHMDEGFSIIDKDLKLRAWNIRFLTLLDVPESVIYEGVSFYDIIRYNADRGEYGPGDPHALTLERVELAQQFEDHVMERTRPNGTILEVRGKAIPDKGFITIYKDVTEQKRAEAALQESVDNLEKRVSERTTKLREALSDLQRQEQWLRLVANALPILIGYVDNDKVYRFSNRMYDEWFGLPPEKVVGTHIRELFGGELYPGHWQTASTALSGEAVARQITLNIRDGRTIEVAFSYLPHFDKKGEVLGYFVLGQDETERKQADIIVKQAQKMEAVGQLTGGIAHDFNNLLTIIIGNLALLSDGENLDEETESLAGDALTSARRGASLVKRLLAFSRKKPLKENVYDPKKVVVEMSDLLRRTLGGSFDVEIRLDGENWSILSDANEFESAVLNMTINSRDAMPDGGTICIAVNGRHVAQARGRGNKSQHKIPDGDYLVVSVTDNGSGMSAEVAERAFEPFFTSKKLSRGTGLGLSMVYGFTRRSGGHAFIDSEPSVGTTVTLYLPRHSSADADQEISNLSENEIPTGNETVLLVEDEPEVLAFTSKVLQKLGYSVIEATDSPDALSKLENDLQVDLVLTDVEMPGGMNGLDLVREVRARWPEKKTLLMSGFPDNAIGQGGLRIDESDLLPKPFEKQDIARMVRNVLDRKLAS